MSQLFQTQDTPLAITLATCGAVIPRHPFSGLPMPFINVYDATRLRALGYGGAHWTIEAATRDARQTRKPGTIFYNFERSATLEAVIEAWNKQCALIKEQASLAGTGAQPIGQSALNLAEAARFACQLFKNRKQTIEDWPSVTPFILLPGETRSERETDSTGKEVIVTIGSFKGYFLDASPEDRKHLGV